MNLRTRIANAVSTVTGWPVTSLNDDVNFFDEMNFDTLDWLDLLIVVETACAVDISDTDREQIATFGQLIACVERNSIAVIVSGGTAARDVEGAGAEYWARQSHLSLYRGEK